MRVPCGEKPRSQRVSVYARVMNYHLLFSVHDQIIMDARDREIAAQLFAHIGHLCAGREHLDYDDRVRNFQRIIGHLLAAIDERIRLEGGARRNSNRCPGQGRRDRSPR